MQRAKLEKKRIPKRVIKGRNGIYIHVKMAEMEERELSRALQGLHLVLEIYNLGVLYFNIQPALNL